MCRDTFRRMIEDKPATDYTNCGRPAVITPALQKWLVSRLLALRKGTACTLDLLARELARKKGVIAEASKIRRHLGEAGYKWLPRGKKRKYTEEQKLERKGFAKLAPFPAVAVFSMVLLQERVLCTTAAWG